MKLVAGVLIGESRPVLSQCRDSETQREPEPQDCGEVALNEVIDSSSTAQKCDDAGDD